MLPLLVPSINLFFIITSCPEAWNKTSYPWALENNTPWHDPTSLGTVICKVTHHVQHWEQKFWIHVRESSLLKITSAFSGMTIIPSTGQRKEGVTEVWPHQTGDLDDSAEVNTVGTNVIFILFPLLVCLLMLPLEGLQAISGGASGKEPACQCRRHMRHRFDPWVRKIPCRRAWQSTPVFLPGESHGQRSLVGYTGRPWGHTESDTSDLAQVGSSVLTLSHLFGFILWWIWTERIYLLFFYGKNLDANLNFEFSSSEIIFPLNTVIVLSARCQGPCQPQE